MGDSQLPPSVAVTGATGFLGGRLAAALASRGVKVYALGRNLEKGVALQRSGVVFRPVPLDDRAGLTEVFKSTVAVVHAAALSSAWGRKEDFERANVDGTRNVIDAARAAGVERLVYISSPSVVSIAGDQHDLREDAPYPETHISHYTRSKMLAEILVRESPLESVVLRPKAIYGPGDTALLPRLIRAARSGRLRQIGDGHATTNLTHVDDVVDGIVLALGSPEAANRIYTLAGDEKVRLWDMIADLTRRLSLPPPRGWISVSRADRIASVLEALWRVLRLPGEPPLTRYAVEILGYDKTYDIGAARRDLGYTPQIRLADGIDELVRHELEGDSRDPGGQFCAVHTSDRRTEVDISLLNAGTVSTRGLYFGAGSKLQRITVPNLFAVIEHPKEGTILFDTGYTERFIAGTRHLPFCIYAMATPVNIDIAATAVSQLRARGINPEQVRWIILSHFHPDHCGGLRDFPNATIVCHPAAWDFVRGKSGLEALKSGMLPGHLPDDFCARLQLLDGFDGAPVAPFAHTHDLFNDGSIRLIDLPGHMPGHVGAWVQADDNQTYALVADAVWTRDAIDHPRFSMHRLLAEDRPRRDATIRLLRQLKLGQPSINIIPAHCPATAMAFDTGFKP